MQISTREKDYIVDPFPLWDNMHILNEPFTDPDILKVINQMDGFYLIFKMILLQAFESCGRSHIACMYEWVGTPNKLS